MKPASNVATLNIQNKLMWQIAMFFSIHKWTFTQVCSVLLTVPFIGDMPEGVAGMGLLTFLFACWKQWEAVKMARRDMKMREEWHREKIRTVKLLREGKLNIDKEILKEILND